MLDYALLAADHADQLLAPGRYRPAVTYEHPPRTSREFADRAAATAWFDAEWPALAGLVRVAADRGLHERAWRLAFLLRDYFFAAKLWDTWVDTHEVALASARAIGDTWAEAVTLNNLGIALEDRGDVDAAERCYQVALPLYRALGDEHGQVTTQANLGWAYYYRGDHESALRELTSALRFYRRTGAERNVAITLRGIALVEEALTACRALDLTLDVAMALNCLGWTHFRSGRHDLAATVYRQAVDLAQQANSPYETARAMTGLGNIAAAADDVAEAQRCWDLAEERHPDLNTVTVGESKARHGG
jgi:tetratricopeptide (TPR) repeat protein